MVESNILLIALQQTKNNGKIKEYILYGEHTHFQFKHFIEFSIFFRFLGNLSFVYRNLANYIIEELTGTCLHQKVRGNLILLRTWKLIL